MSVSDPVGKGERLCKKPVLESLSRAPARAWLSNISDIETRSKVCKTAGTAVASKAAAWITLKAETCPLLSLG